MVGINVPISFISLKYVDQSHRAIIYWNRNWISVLSDSSFSPPFLECVCACVHIKPILIFCNIKSINVLRCVFGWEIWYSMKSYYYTIYLASHTKLNIWISVVFGCPSSCFLFLWKLDYSEDRHCIICISSFPKLHRYLIQSRGS